MAFRTAELDGKLIVIVDDCELAAAVKSLDYAWQESTDRTEYVEQILAFLSRLAAGMAEGHAGSPSS